MKHTAQTAFGALAALCAVGISAPATAAWEPIRPVEFIVPAGTGGGADQMARTIQGIVTKHNLMKQPLVVINKSGGAGGEGFLDVKASGNNPHKIIITLSNLFTTPLATGIPFSFKDLTPVAMLALDEFVLWVNAEKPYQTAKEPTFPTRAAAKSPFSSSATTSIRPSTIRSKRSRSGAVASCVRSACSTRSR
jgi:putative tricarboxylic transport membrane protein